MTRPFQIVENKLFESDFFFEQIAAANFGTIEYYLSAFFSATRSVTFALQASLTDVPGFSDWYESEREKLRGNDAARWFVDARNASQKVGATFVRSGTSGVGGNQEFFFEGIFDDKGNLAGGAFVLRQEGAGGARTLPTVLERCRAHMVEIMGMMRRCYEQFGPDIDPQLHYTLANLERVGKSVEDCEEELGFPRGWTSGIPEEHRLAALRRHACASELPALFEKYLGSSAPTDGE